MLPENIKEPEGGETEARDGTIAAMRPLLLCFLLASLCPAAFAQNEIASLLASVSGDAQASESAVSVALKSQEAGVRAIAARIATTRRMTSLVPAIAALVDREPDVNTAREMIRAMIILGGLRHVDRGFYVSERFDRRLDTDVAVAAARHGAPAVEPYFASMIHRDIDDVDFFRIVMWGRPELGASIAPRLLKADPEAFQGLLFVSAFEPKLYIDRATLEAALTQDDADLRAEAAWFLMNQVVKGNAVDSGLREVIRGILVPRTDPDLIASVELLRRAVGFPPRDFPEFNRSLSSTLVRIRMFLGSQKALDLLDETQHKIVTAGIGEGKALANANLPPFVVPSPLPRGLAEGIMSITGCSGGWLGTAKIQVDDAGLVASRDLAGVQTSEACRRALDLFVQFSIADNYRMSAPRRSDVSLVRAPKGPLCLDETSVPSHRITVSAAWATMRRPAWKWRAAPVWPEGVKRVPLKVGVEVIVTAAGCVRSARVVESSSNAAVDRAALVAAQQWQFSPASVDTTSVELPVDVTVEFKP